MIHQNPDEISVPNGTLPPHKVGTSFLDSHSGAFVYLKPSSHSDPMGLTGPWGRGVRPVPPESTLGEQQFDPENPSKVPADQVIVGRQPRTLSSIEWLGEQIKHGFASAVRTFRMMGIIFSIWWHGGSVESLKTAAEKARGGILVKAIQFACSSPAIAQDLFDDDHEAFTKALSHVTSSNKPMTRAELIHCLEEAGIDYDPAQLDNRKNLGTGSIGEVNEIILNGGGHLIVKTVSSSSETRVYSDLRVLRFMLGLINFFLPGTLNKGTKHAIFSFFESVKEEVNLITEANKTRQQDFAFKAIAQHHIFDIQEDELPDYAYKLPSRPDGWKIQLPDTDRVLLKLPVDFKVPAVSGDTVSPHALGMEKINGATLSENDQPELRAVAAQLFNINPEKIMDDHLAAFRFSLKRMAFAYWSYCYAQTGFFNADMHDGNVMVTVENSRLCIYFIDLGNAQRVSRNAVKATYIILGAIDKLREVSGVAARQQYADVVIKCLKELGEYESDKARWDKLKQEVLNLIPYDAYWDTKGDDTRKKVIELFNRAYNCDVKISKETAALFRAQILIGSQNELTGEAMKSMDEIVTSLVELLGNDNSSTETDSLMENLADQNALLLLIQQDPELREELRGLLETVSLSPEQLQDAQSELLSKVHLPTDEFRNEVHKLIAQWQIPPANPRFEFSDWWQQGLKNMPVYS
ncbi:AarF/UbiB family protein [Endozoicomonas sp. ONNA2]|uniref:AarF/UbiB family protein n=1 Tax=Endozoicomonas sp. ONNA2 TaxID=2828741 RepID=UPI002147C411|nr:AarF/UbiB family protein [Endozoicomonas sp. ONNA2]